MWSELDDNDKEIYKRLILAYASLSEAFAQKEDFSSGSKKKLRKSKVSGFKCNAIRKYSSKQRTYIYCCL